MVSILLPQRDTLLTAQSLPRQPAEGRGQRAVDRDEETMYKSKTGWKQSQMNALRFAENFPPRKPRCQGFWELVHRAASFTRKWGNPLSSKARSFSFMPLASQALPGTPKSLSFHILGETQPFSEAPKSKAVRSRFSNLEPRHP